jgi:DNA-binding beta-propeller fold protein YncE
MKTKSLAGLLAGVASLAVAQVAFAADEKLLVSGRWDNTILVIDLAKAMEPANDGTTNAIVNTVRVTPDIDANGTGKADTPASGQPVNVVLSPDKRRIYVVNHSGKATTAATEKFQHGHAGLVVVLDLAKTLDPANKGTLNAVEAFVPTGGFGPVGFAITPDGKHALVSNSEGDVDEEGGKTVAVMDLATNKVLHQVPLAYGKPGFPCPPNPIPHAGPHMTFGCFPDSNAVVISPRAGGVAFTANGGTDDVSVIDLKRALAADPAAEIARIPVATGPWGMAISPDGALVAVANRENARTGEEGNTVSLINVEKAAAAGAPGADVKAAKEAEVARVLVGTNNPATASRPFSMAFTPDGTQLITSQFRANNVSIVDVKKALAGDLGAEAARIKLETPSGGPSRPRGIVITPDGRYAAITGAARAKEGSGILWILDIAARKVVGRVTGVGNETYLLALLPGK